MIITSVWARDWHSSAAQYVANHIHIGLPCTIIDLDIAIQGQVDNICRPILNIHTGHYRHGHCNNLIENFILEELRLNFSLFSSEPNQLSKYHHLKEHSIFYIVSRFRFQSWGCIFCMKICQKGTCWLMNCVSLVSLVSHGSLPMNVSIYMLWNSEGFKYTIGFLYS